MYVLEGKNEASYYIYVDANINKTNINFT